MNPSRHSRRGRFLSSCKLVLLQQHRHPVAERRLVLVARGPPVLTGEMVPIDPPCLWIAFCVPTRVSKTTAPMSFMVPSPLSISFLFLLN